MNYSVIELPRIPAWILKNEEVHNRNLTDIEIYKSYTAKSKQNKRVKTYNVYCYEMEIDDSVHALEITGYDYRSDDIRLLYKSDTLFFGYNDSVSIKEYGIWWFKTKEEAENVFNESTN